VVREGVVVDYRIATVRSTDSGRPVGYFDRWHALVFLDDRELGYGQGFTRRRAERRAEQLASRHNRSSVQIRPDAHIHESVYRADADHSSGGVEAGPGAT
jgi:hypothetical protein